MREIGTIADEAAAQRLADYLLTLDITTKLDPRPAGTAVWVHREERLDQARREMAEFLRAPDDPKYRGAVQVARDLRKKAEREERQHVANSISLSGRWNQRPAGRVPLTVLLIAASLVVAAISQLGANKGPIMPLFLISIREAPIGHDAEGNVVMGLASEGLEGVKRGEVWRLVTPIFIHFGPVHLLFNMLWLYDLGGLIEMRRGGAYLLALVLISAITSNLGQYAISGPSLAGGMSGVVYALFGYVWMVGRYNPAGGMAVSRSTIQTMIFWLFFCMTGVIGPIANAAHVVGLLVGMLLGFAPQAPRVLRRWF